MSAKSVAYIKGQQLNKDRSDSANTRESGLLTELAGHTDELLSREKNSLGQVEAVELVNVDLELASGIQDKEYRLWAAAMMGYAGEAQGAYKTELAQKSPEMASEASQAMEQIEAAQVIHNVDDLLKALNARTQELALRDKDTVGQAEASERVNYDVALMAGITNEGDRLFAAVSMGEATKQQAGYMAALREQAPELAAEVEEALREDTRRVSAKEDRKAAELAALGIELPEPIFGIEDEHGRIEPPMGDDVLVGVDTLNSIEPVLTISGTGSKPIVADISADSPDAVKDQVQAVSPEAAQAPGVAKRAEKAAEETSEFLKRLFHVAGNEYHFKDKTDPKQSLAFVDKNSQIATPHDDPQVIDSMLKLAEGKGWDKLNLKGSEDFKREAWIKASARGFEVTGYKPSEIDIARMQVERDKLNTNQIKGAAVQGGTIEGQAKAAGGVSAEQLKQYTGSKEFAETVAGIAEKLKASGYPVDDKFKEAIGQHLVSEFQQGRKIEKGPEQQRAAPALRLVEPSRTVERDMTLEHAGREHGGISR